MTDDTRQALMALVEKWREEAGRMAKRGWLQSIRRSAIENCADELEAMIPAARPVSESALACAAPSPDMPHTLGLPWPSPAGSYRCELPRGHKGDHRIFTGTPHETTWPSSGATPAEHQP